MSKHTRFNIICVVILIIALGGTYVGLDRLLSEKTAHGIQQARDMYAQPEDTVDVLFIGSSHVHCDVNTALLWEEYGMSAYDLSAAEQPLWITYYYLKEFCKNQSPEVIVLEVFSAARYLDDYQYTFLDDNLYGMKFSLNKLQMLSVSCELDQLWDYFPSFTAYHDRYDELTEEDWEYVTMSDSERAAFKGYTPYFGGEGETWPTVTVTTESGGLTEKSETYLRKIIEYVQQNDMELFLFASPYVTNDDETMIFNQIGEIAAEYGIEFRNFNFEYDEMGIDFSTDFWDWSHLDYYGGLKFTSYLGDILEDRFDISDHRGDERYESWDRNVEQIRSQVEEAESAESSEGT